MQDAVGIFNEVMGPVMRGPSSSHTAGAWAIGRMARALLGEKPRSVTVTFDPQGSMARTYRPLSSDLGFAAGLLEMELTDPGFPEALDRARKAGISLEFGTGPLDGDDHPNAMRIELNGSVALSLMARSTGGGAVEVTEIGGWPVRLNGKKHDFLAAASPDTAEEIARWIAEYGAGRPETDPSPSVFMEKKRGRALIHAALFNPLPEDLRRRLLSHAGVERIHECPPHLLVPRGKPLFGSAKETENWARRNGKSLGEAGLAYECALLGIPEQEALGIMSGRFGIMRESVREGLDPSRSRMRLQDPFAHLILGAAKRNALFTGGIHTLAAARAMAVMHASNSGGVVCAAPTGGSAGVIPGVLVSLEEETHIPEEKLVLGLFAASSAGLVIAKRATFAAEVAGCQVEIGAAGAMAAAAVADIAGGDARQALDAAAVFLQNIMGSVCDPVQGTCEIPCHTRNAAAASAAFLCADLVLGGYRNPVPLDETVDAVLAVGRAMPPELRCTALGGLAATPSAVNLPANERPRHGS